MNADQFGIALDEGVAEGVLSDEAHQQAAEIRTARTWLFLLGYLKRNSESGKIGPLFLAALNTFRADVGIESAPALLDPPTLSALKRLVCFDSVVAVEDTAVDSEQRFSDFAPDSDILVRAVGLRLYALDLVDRLPGRTPNRAKTNEGLARFAKVHSLLGMHDVPADASHDTLRALFDLDPVLARLRTNEQHTSIFQPAGSSPSEKRANRQLAKKFVNSVARVELWLIGYLARPRTHMWTRDNSNRSLPSALRAFWRDQPETARPPKKELDHLDGRFFERMQEVTGQTDGQGELQAGSLEAEFLKNPDLARAVRKEARSIGARLLDGVRRAARFVFGWIKMGLRKIVALARNMASLITRKVRKVFSAVRDIIDSLAISWRFLVRDPVPGSDPEHLLIMHDLDFDFILLGNPEANPDQVRKIGEGVGLMARLLAVSWRFVGRLIDAFAALAKRSGLGGWFGALMTLLKAREWITDMRETIADIRSTRAQLESLGLSVTA